MARLNGPEFKASKAFAKVSFTSRISVESPFDIGGLTMAERLKAGRRGLQATFGDETGRKLWGRFNQRFYSATGYELSRTLGGPTRSILARARNNALGRGSSQGKLRVHKPLGGPRNFTTTKATRTEISDALSKGFRGSAQTGRLDFSMFEVVFAPKFRLLGFIGAMMDQGNMQGEGLQEQTGIRNPTQTPGFFGQQFTPVVLRPTKSRFLLIPSYNADSYSNAPKQMLADTLAYGSSDPTIRYIRFGGGSNRRRLLTDRPPVDGWRFVIRGFHQPKRGRRLPRGIYAVPGRKGKDSDNRMVMTHQLRKSVRIKPKGWYSFALHDWFHGLGSGQANYDTWRKDVEKALVAGVENAFRRASNEEHWRVKAAERTARRAGRR
tara:strand:- start:698 stop:1837 length:1140 start_codon:yes stop_codon:yes gene_type:complete